MWSKYMQEQGQYIDLVALSLDYFSLIEQKEKTIAWKLVNY